MTGESGAFLKETHGKIIQAGVCSLGWRDGGTLPCHFVIVKCNAGIRGVATSLCALSIVFFLAIKSSKRH